MAKDENDYRGPWDVAFEGGADRNVWVAIEAKWSNEHRSSLIGTRVVTGPNGGPTRVHFWSGEAPPMPDEKVVRMFAPLCLILPDRLITEDVGDAIEKIARLNLKGWRRRLKVASTYAWVLLNALREVIASWKGKSR